MDTQWPNGQSSELTVVGAQFRVPGRLLDVLFIERKTPQFNASSVAVVANGVLFTRHNFHSPIFTAVSSNSHAPNRRPVQAGNLYVMKPGNLFNS